MAEKIRKGKEKGEVSPMGQMPLSIIQDGPFQAFISSIAPWPFHSGAEACIFKLPQPISTLFKYSWLVTARLIRAKRKSGTASLYWPCHFRMEAVPIPQGLSTLHSPLSPLPSLPVTGIHENGHRTVVDQGNLHIRAKFAAFHPAFQQGRQFPLEQFIQGNGLLRPCSADEGGPVALPGGGPQRV